MQTKLTLSELAKYFSDESEAYKLVEKIQWANGVVCPHCGTLNRAYLLEPQNGVRVTRTGKPTYRRVWKCGACREQFSVLVGTIFEGTKIALSKWLLAIHELCSDKNGISSLEVGRKLGITQKSAWFMAHRIRYAMARPPILNKLQGTVEADETYIGGKLANMHKSKRDKMEKKRGRGSENKTPVLILVERDGEARSRVMQQVSGTNIKAVLLANVERSAAIMTDTFPSYPAATKGFASHETVA